VRTIAMCEADPRCQAFLAKAWPGVPVWPDVRTFSLDNATESRYTPRSGQTDAAGNGERRVLQSDRRSCGVWLLTAGVPCQPASRSGKQRGKEDDRWLWPAAVSVFAAIRPAWAIFENPPGIGDVGLDGILSDLGREGYAVRVFSLGACAIGAPHRRMRYWIVCRRLANTAEGNRECHEGEQAAGLVESSRAQYQSAGSSASQLADTPQRGQREHGSAPREARHADERGESGVAISNAKGHHERWTKGSGGVCKRNGENEPNEDEDSVGIGPWSNYVWLPCADGKVRRAPDSAVELVDGRPVDIIETLAKEGWPHRSVLGALGNSIVWPVASKIIAAMIQSESDCTAPGND
jgi:site-specific DNA-cytosine methylase